MSDLAIAALLAVTILIASMISVEIGLSVALIELLGGVIVGNTFNLSVPGWLAFLGSFAGIVTGWFAWILRPQREVRRPRGLLPARASRFVRIPEFVLDLVIAPLAAAIERASGAARRLQHGKLQAYILYVIVALLGMGSVAWLAAAP